MVKPINIERLYLHKVPGLQGKGGWRDPIFNKYYLGARLKAAGAYGVNGRGGHPGINNLYVIRCVCVYVSFFHSSAKSMVT